MQINKRWAPFFTGCLLFSVSYFLVFIGIKGAVFVEPYFSRAKAFLIVGASLSLLAGFRAILFDTRKGLKGYKLHAVGCLMVTVVLFDYWISEGDTGLRSVTELLIAWVVLAGSIWVQWRDSRT